MIFTSFFEQLQAQYDELGEAFVRRTAKAYSRFLDAKLDELCKTCGCRPQALEVGDGECRLWVVLHDGRSALFQDGMFFADGYAEVETIPSAMLCRYFDHYVAPILRQQPFPAQYVGKYDSRKLVRVA